MLLNDEGALRPTIFAEMSALAASTGAINLGQGFPDTDGPPEIVEAAVAALRAGHNQYPPGDGIPSLRARIASMPSRCTRARCVLRITRCTEWILVCS